MELAKLNVGLVVVTVGLFINTVASVLLVVLVKVLLMLRLLKSITPLEDALTDPDPNADVVPAFKVPFETVIFPE